MSHDLPEGETQCYEAETVKVPRTVEDDARELWQALNDLSFECDGFWCTKAPSRETYNKTFDVMDRYRSEYGIIKVSGLPVDVPEGEI